MLALSPAAVSAASLRNPAHNVAPTAAFVRYCLRATAPGPCNKVALAAIDDARRQEHLGPLLLPANFARLSAAKQLLAVTNAERASRRLPAFTELSALDRLANGGAVEHSDAPTAGLATYAAVWAGGYPTPLAADFAWMYDDGYGGSNLLCRGSVRAGCWAHRDGILSGFAGHIGIGAVHAGSHQASFAELFVERR